MMNVIGDFGKDLAIVKHDEKAVEGPNKSLDTISSSSDASFIERDVLLKVNEIEDLRTEVEEKIKSGYQVANILVSQFQELRGML